MIACYKGHYAIASYLVSLMADVNRKSVKGNTALHDCAESGSLEIMKLLLNNCANVDVDSYGGCCGEMWTRKVGVVERCGLVWWVLWRCGLVWWVLWRDVDS